MSARWRARKGLVLWWAESPDYVEVKHFTTHGEALAYAVDRAQEST